MRSNYPLLFYVGILFFVGCAETSLIDRVEPLEAINSESYNNYSQDIFYYYYYDEKIFLTERRDLIFVEFKDAYTKDNSIGAAIDNQYPHPYYNCTFGDGNTSYISIADTSVPDSSRRTLYVNIINPF